MTHTSISRYFSDLNKNSHAQDKSYLQTGFEVEVGRRGCHVPCRGKRTEGGQVCMGYKGQG